MPTKPFNPGTNSHAFLAYMNIFSFRGCSYGTYPPRYSPPFSSISTICLFKLIGRASFPSLIKQTLQTSPSIYGWTINLEPSP